MRKRALVSLLAAAASMTGVVAAQAAVAAPAFAQAAPTVDELRAALRAALKAADAAEAAYIAALAEFNTADAEAVAAEKLAAEAKGKADELAKNPEVAGYESAVVEAETAKTDWKLAQDAADKLADVAMTAKAEAKDAAEAYDAAVKEQREAAGAIEPAKQAIKDAEAKVEPAETAEETARAALGVAEGKVNDAVGELAAAKQALENAAEADREQAQEVVDAAERKLGEERKAFDTADTAHRKAQTALSDARRDVATAVADKGKAEERLVTADTQLPIAESAMARTKTDAETAEAAATTAQNEATPKKTAYDKAAARAEELGKGAAATAYKEARKEEARLAGLATDARGKATKLKTEADKLKAAWDAAEAKVKKAQTALDAALFPVKIGSVVVKDNAVRYPGKNVPLPIIVNMLTDADRAVVYCAGFSVELDETYNSFFDSGFYLEPGDPGKGTCTVKVSNTHGVSASKSFTYNFRNHARFGSFNASPEPVKKGRKITVRGSLAATNANGTAYGHLNGARVNVFFKPKGGSWVSKGSATTSGKGSFALGFTAKRDGTWKAVYAGTGSFTKAASTADFVDVR